MSNFGKFPNPVSTLWMNETGPNRNMKLNEDVSYTDPSGREWKASKGDIINGASIPQALWSTIGSPYIGDYRDASVLHDVACNTPGVNRKEADNMFYYACLCKGCSYFRARVFYLGVRIGAWASLSLTSDEDTFRGEFFSYDDPKILSTNDQIILMKLKEIGTNLWAMSDDTTPEDMDTVIEKHLILTEVKYL
ncbi:MAG TPA: DUF1353 domain-containing protein [Scandinavium sp.]|jgi:hypothetical protein|uniref:DUF1353 domain-containing protein n=1 Tax=Scandinavium sp. TaxID=2830653 RepID=UPI002E377393|nr:DUF1353 domain-containing protein [Scandinavium sp.]HEX4502674.1 DUF1353 domain-containing protein [Scandinavium sp.]